MFEINVEIPKREVIETFAVVNEQKEKFLLLWSLHSIWESRP